MSAEALRAPATLRTVFAKSVRDQRRSLAWWSIGIVFVVLVYAAFWPSVRSNAAQFARYMDQLPEAIRNMLAGASFGSPSGYVQADLFSLLGPVLLLVHAIGSGARAIAGEQESGTLDLLLSTPVSRRRVVLDKSLSMAATTLLLTALMWAALVSVGPAYGLRLSIAGLGAACLGLFLLAVGFGAIALAVGAATGSRSAAIGATGGIAVVTFVLNTLAPSVAVVRPLRFVSPFHYYSGHSPLTSGFDAADVLVLAAIPLIAVLVGVMAFDRRDLAT